MTRVPPRADYRMSRDRPPIVTVAVVSCSALAYELTLMRLLAVVQWHHLAFMVISLALMGYGASGSWLALFPKAGREAFDTFFHLSTLGFCMSLVASTRAALKVPFNALDLLWDPAQGALLALVVLFLSAPFFFAGSLVALSLGRFGSRIPRLYAADLLGAGLGSTAAVAGFHWLDPLAAVSAVSGLAALAALCGGLERPGRMGSLAAAAAVGFTALTAALPGPGLIGSISPYKPLAQALETPGARVVREAVSPLGWLAVVESPEIPFRQSPGASLLSRRVPPEQRAVFTDGDGPEAINRFTGDLEAVAFRDDTTTALAFHMAGPKARQVLLPMAGTGMTALLARYHGAPDVLALERDPRKTGLVTETFAGFAGWSRLSETTRFLHRGFRGHLATGNGGYDLILMPPVGAGTAPGALALTEAYELTVEALRACIRSLSPGGLLSISWWIRLPPRDGLRLADTAIRALREEGHAHPADGLAVIRGWRTGTLVVRKGGLLPGDPDAVRRFCRERGFDPVFFPGIAPEEVNRRTVLRSPVFFEAVSALAGPDRRSFLDRYKFTVEAVDDNRPYFHFYDRWSGFWELLGGGQAGGLEVLEWAYPMVLFALGLSVLLSGACILLPVAFRRLGPGRPGLEGWRPLVYFSGLGAGFIVLEVVFVQTATRCLHEPVLAAAAVLGGVLVFAGAGSRFAARWADGRQPGSRPEIPAVLGVLAGAAAGFGLLRLLADHGAHDWPGLRVALVVAALAPMAFAMGMPFSLGLSRLAASRPGWVPLAWSVNGSTSVVGAVLAALSTLQLGFAATVAIACGFYLAAAAAGPLPKGPPV